VNRGYTIFSTACSGCHGHLAEGKLGPALHDDYWTYPGNMYDKGLFETIYAGGQGMMGPQKGIISQDEILQIMSWIRSVYDGDPKKQSGISRIFFSSTSASWLSGGLFVDEDISPAIIYKESLMKRILTLMVISGAIFASGVASAYDGTNCKEAGNCWEAKPGFPEKIAGSKYDPKHDPKEVGKQQASIQAMDARNAKRVANAKATGKFDYDAAE